MKANPPQSRESRPSGCTADLATCPGRRLNLHESSTAPVHGVAPRGVARPGPKTQASAWSWAGSCRVKLTTTFPHAGPRGLEDLARPCGEKHLSAF